jgi:hypothetical protein
VQMSPAGDENAVGALAEPDGAAPPPAATLDGSAQRPQGTATWLVAHWACSASSSAGIPPAQVSVPVEAIAVTLPAASRRRSSPIRPLLETDALHFWRLGGNISEQTLSSLRGL